MSFEPSAAEEELRAKVRQFAETQVKPVTFQLDQNNRFPKEIVKQMGQLGLMGLPYGKEYGGTEQGVVAYAIAVEELSRVDGGVGVILSAHTSLGTYPIAAFGNEAQKQKYLVPLCTGEHLGAFGLTEPNAGSDAGGTETTAVDMGDYYLMNGRKIFITNGGEADTYVVFAVTTPGIGTRGISAFILEKGWEGFTFQQHYDKLGIRSSITCELDFKDLKVPKENLLGEEGQGFKIAMATLDGGRIGIAAQALGIAQGAYESSLEYSKERVQFGKPICQQQIISFKIADMATKLRCARFLVYSAADLKQQHKPYGMEAAMAKMYASDSALEIVNEALQIYGGSGYLKGMDVERMYRDAKITTIYEGTNEIQRVVIAAHILGKAAKAVKAPAEGTKAAGTAGAAQAAGPVQTPETGLRKRKIYQEGTAGERVAQLAAQLVNDGYDFTLRVPSDTPIAQADRVVSAGMGIGEKENMALIENLAKAAGAAVGSSRPVAEFQQFVGMDRFVGLSGQKFHGSLYIACGISGAVQHLKGINDATTIVAINIDPNADIFKNCDYGIVGDLKEILPMLAEAIGGKKAELPKPGAAADRYVCGICGFVYDPAIGDPNHGIAPGTAFEDLPKTWKCPVCGAKEEYFKAKKN